jgi:hypothetical protein
MILSALQHSTDGTVRGYIVCKLHRSRFIVYILMLTNTFEWLNRKEETGGVENVE